jgi:hypothetical protein
MQEEALEWNLGFIVIESTITRDVDRDNQPLPGTYIKMINHYQVFVSGVLWTLFLTLPLIPTPLLDEIYVSNTLWKWVPHKVVRLT